MNKKVVIVGATGQVGTPLIKNLLKLGHDVRAIVRRRSQANKENYKNMNLLEQKSLFVKIQRMLNL